MPPSAGRSPGSGHAREVGGHGRLGQADLGLASPQDQSLQGLAAAPQASSILIRIYLKKNKFYLLSFLKFLLGTLCF